MEKSETLRTSKLEAFYRVKLEFKIVEFQLVNLDFCDS